MGLSVGSTLGVYEIRGLIAAGGMGEVYRAHDPRLGRDVALKILPEDRAADSERLKRFEREARAASSLNHPGVLQVYDVGSDDGKHFVVSELLEGETLRERLKNGTLPLRKGVELAVQIAEALAAAHERGIVHRDLKPENLFVTTDGRVKILDFGLAKLADTHRVPVDDGETLTGQTDPGTVMGSAGYMAPEQVRGEEVDRRADVFSFGAVLYEILTGERAFCEETRAETLTATLHAEPEERPGPEGELPPLLSSVLRRCLEKQPEERFQSTRDLAFALREVVRPASEKASLAPAQGAATRRVRAAGLIAAVLAAIGIGVLLDRLTPEPDGRRPIQVDIALPPGERIAWEVGGPVLASSADGQRIAYVSAGPDGVRLFVRDLGDEEARVVPGTENAVNPFFSPDGRWLGFISGGKLRKVPVDGGAGVITLGDAARALGASWGPHDTIVLGQGAGGLWRVPAAGGEPELLARPGPGSAGTSYRWPHLLPDGEQLLFTVRYDGAPSSFESLSLADRRRRKLGPADSGTRWLAPGYLVSPRWGGGQSHYILTAARAGPDLTPSGPWVSFTPRLHPGSRTFPAMFDVAGDGTLIYVPWLPRQSCLVRVGRDGVSQPLNDPESGLVGMTPRLSPDGEQLAYAAGSIDGASLWIHDLARGTRRQIAHGSAQLPSWSRDGRYIVFRWNRDGGQNVYRIPADGSGEAEALTTGSLAKNPTSISPDGRWVLFAQNDPDTLWDLWEAPLEDHGEAHPVLVEPGSQTSATYSPDGRLLAYLSDESGRLEVYVRASDGSGGKSVVSTAGGVEPVWSRDGRQLFYRNDRQLLSVAVYGGPEPSYGHPVPVLEREFASYTSSFSSGYDVTPDGEGFVMVEPGAQTQPHVIRLVLGWREEVERRLRAAEDGGG